MTVPVEQCVLESEVKQAVMKQIVGDITVRDTGDGFYVQVEFQFVEPRLFWLTSRRSPHAPRLFKHLGRLNAHLRTLVPSSRVHIVREIPAEPTLS